MTTFTPTGQAFHSLPSRALPVLTLGILSAILFIPFRFDVGFTYDSWYFNLYAMYEPFFMLPGRPLIAWPHNIAYWLSPGTFSGFNLVLCLVTFLRGALTYAILCRLGFTKALAFSVSALAILFPADQGAYYIGALTVYSSSAFFLGALYLLLKYWQQPNFRTLIGIWILQILCLGMYEAAYPLIVVSPILVYALSRRLNRRFWKTVRYWYLLPALNLIRYAYILVFKAEALDYQAGITQLDGLDNILSSLLNVYKQHFLSGWTSNTFLQNSGWFSGAGLQNWNFLPYALVVGLLIFAVCLWLSKREDFKRPLSSKLPSKHQGIVLAVVGLGIILLSVAVYLPTSARDSHLRTYYTSVIGASLTIAVMLSTLTKNRLFFASTIAMLGALGCLRLLEQGNAYVQDSEQQQQLVLDTVKLVPNLPPYTGLIVLDETTDHQWEQTFHSYWHMQYPFILAYLEPALFTVVCPSEEEPAPRAICEYQEEQLHVHPYDNPEWSLPYERLIFLRYQGDGQLSLIGQLPNHPEYNPYNIIQPDVPPSSHIYRMFGEPAPAS